MKKVLQILKWGMLLSLMVVVLSFTNQKQNKQMVFLNQINIEVSEDEFMTEQIALKYIEQHNFSFDSVALSNFYLNELEVAFLQHPAVKNAQVYSNQEGVININLQQRKAVVRIKTDNTDYYLDEQGMKMPLSSEYTPRVLVVTGEVNESNHSSIFSFVERINKEKFWKSQITQLHFNNNEVIIIPRVGSQKIHFGTLTDVNKKLGNLYQFYKQAMPVKGWENYSEISLAYNNQIVCTKK
ncbi:MAG: Cell division protein FtsQ [Cryomorphaceae bacterium]|nr:MAG: Cell division protein FtsQ [Cryomorphaceae bacterium]